MANVDVLSHGVLKLFELHNLKRTRRKSLTSQPKALSDVWLPWRRSGKHFKHGLEITLPDAFIAGVRFAERALKCRICVGCSYIHGCIFNEVFFIATTVMRGGHFLTGASVVASCIPRIANPASCNAFPSSF